MDKALKQLQIDGQHLEEPGHPSVEEKRRVVAATASGGGVNVREARHSLFSERGVLLRLRILRLTRVVAGSAPAGHEALLGEQSGGVPVTSVLDKARHWQSEGTANTSRQRSMIRAERASTHRRTEGLASKTRPKPRPGNWFL